MVTIVKHEWHSVDSQFAYELTEDDLSEIYPDLKKKEIKSLLKQIEKEKQKTVDNLKKKKSKELAKKVKDEFKL